MAPLRRPKANTKKRTIQQMAITIGLVLTGLYALLVLVVFLNQAALLYFPDRQPAEAFFVRRSGVAPWPSESDFRGFVGTGAGAKPHGTVIVFHGNAGRAIGRTYFVEALERLGFRTVLAEYPGYGGRAGAPGEKAFVDDARESVTAAAQQWGRPVYLAGESLGCGVAAAAAADPKMPVDGLILITPWDSLPDIAQATFWFLPARWMVRDRFDSVKNLSELRVPVAVLLSERDEVIPVRHGQRLYDAIGAPKQLWTFPGAGHNSWPTGPTEGWWGEATEFLRKGE